MRTTHAFHTPALFLTLLTISGPGWAEEQQPQPVAARGYAQIVQDDSPVAYWRFSPDKGRRLSGQVSASADQSALTAKVSGKVQFVTSHLAQPEFPLFGSSNSSIELTGRGSYLRVADPGEHSVFDFDNGDAMTLEAWINPEQASGSTYYYVIAKGRTYNPGVSRDNHNFALRLQPRGGSGAVSFLFRSRGEKGDWHRWTSNETVTFGDGWHHIAVTYLFGDPKSVRGYIDGKAVSGKWDMGGATKAAPVVDNDEVWIGSSMGGNQGSSFRGQLDEVAVYRSALSAKRIAARYQFRGRPLPEVDLKKIPADRVLVEIFEKIPDRKSWDFRSPEKTDSFTTEAFAFVEAPRKYSARGIQIDRSNPYLIRASGWATIPIGKHRVLVRSRNSARLYWDGVKIAETPFHNISSSAHGTVFDVDTSLAPHIRPLHRGDQQVLVDLEGDGKPHLVRFEMIVGGRNHRPEFGETSVSFAREGEDFRLLSQTLNVLLTDADWRSYARRQQEMFVSVNQRARQQASPEEDRYWQWRHEQAREAIAKQKPIEVPRIADSETVYNDVDRFIAAKLQAAKQTPEKLSDDLAFFRRLSLDTTGTILNFELLQEFLADSAANKRSRWIDRMLEQRGWADRWMGYWQDVLAENPNLIKPTLNNSGPFRFWLHESFLDNKPFDRFVTELVMMEGSRYFGGPAGFAIASQNDAPMAAKAHIIGQAFLGLEMKCARCHDAPFHDFEQKDLFSLAAMLDRGPQTVPATSSIPGGDKAAASLIVEVTLKPGEKIVPQWPFPELSTGALSPQMLRNPGDQREQLAALITSPTNRRFPQVIVNRLWKVLMGRGIVEPVDDWDFVDPSHPQLLDYLANEFVTSGYDLKHVCRLIFNSHAYQRRPHGTEQIVSGEPYLFAAPIQRRMSAEQVVDSLFIAAGKDFDADVLSLDIDSAMSVGVGSNFGEPKRSWEFTTLANERDRPSLSLPMAQPFVTTLETFGWRSTRQDPLTVRNEDPTVLQPAIMANGLLSQRVALLSDDSALTELALQDIPLTQLIDQICLRILSRAATPSEQEIFGELLADGYQGRKVVPTPPKVTKPRLPRRLVSWSNHLNPKANEIKVELQRAVEAGDPPTNRLQSDWRTRMEDMVWVCVNSPEFVFVP